MQVGPCGHTLSGRTVTQLWKAGAQAGAQAAAVRDWKQRTPERALPQPRRTCPAAQVPSPPRGRSGGRLLPGRLGPRRRPLAVPTAPPPPSESPPPSDSGAGATAQPRASAPAPCSLLCVCLALSAQLGTRGVRPPPPSWHLTRRPPRPHPNHEHWRERKPDCHWLVTGSFQASLMLVTVPLRGSDMRGSDKSLVAPTFHSLQLSFSPVSGFPRLLPIRMTWGA